MIICPICEGAAICRATIKDTTKVVYVCIECDSVWLKRSAIFFGDEKYILNIDEEEKLWDKLTNFELAE